MTQKSVTALEQAMQLVIEGWLPVDPKIFNHISKGLLAGNYDKNRELLLQDLKTDISLFMFCLRRLIERRNRLSDLEQGDVEPSRLFQLAPIEIIKDIFCIEVSSISPHSLRCASEIQAQRLTQSVVSASVADTLAKYYEVPPDTSYSCALFRELGLTLIAWNYPHVYARVLSLLSINETIDTALSKVLGFSPSLLGVSIARSWSISSDIRYAIGDTSVDSGSPGVGLTLQKICQVGETLARVSDPERYPNAISDWRTASKDIAATLGKDGFKALKERVAKNLSGYLEAAPHLYKLPDVLEVEPPALAGQDKAQVKAINRYVQHCPAQIRERFDFFYTGLRAASVNKDSLQFLFSEIVVPLGFARGCVYLIEPEMLMLVPRLAIGNAKLTDFQALSYNVISHQSNPVIAAFRSAVPVIEENDPSETTRPSFVSGSLGSIQRAGVLYLEMTPEVASDVHANPMVYFKAIRNALSDCLDLS